MPRPADTENVQHQQRQRRYRERLAAAGKPEASAVDVAVAEAVAAAVSADALAGKLAPDGFLARLIRDAVRRLVAAGYDPNEARRKAKQRLGRFAYPVPPGTEPDRRD
jgi:2-keto-3-deoxy-L-rhamnonate aldolase RhmA